MPVEGGDGLASVAEVLAELTAAARAGGLDDTAALTALAAARRIAAELEHSELALIRAGRRQRVAGGQTSVPWRLSRNVIYSVGPVSAEYACPGA